jgi:chromosome segregation ATPase
MIKKLLIGVGLAVIAGLWFFGRDTFSYVRTSLGWMKDSVKNSVPVQFEIERARRMIKDLEPEVRKNVQAIAKEEVEVERLQKQIADTETRLAKEKEEMLKLHADAKSSKESFAYGGRTYTAAQVRMDLASRFARFTTTEATLNSWKDTLVARQRSLEGAQKKLKGTLDARRQLLVEVENLQARLQMVAAAQTTSNHNFDDSQLSRVKELVGDLRTRLDVEERMVTAEGYYAAEIPVSEPSTENIMEQISQHFATATPGAKENPQPAAAVAKTR